MHQQLTKRRVRSGIPGGGSIWISAPDSAGPAASAGSAEQPQQAQQPQIESKWIDEGRDLTNLTAFLEACPKRHSWRMSNVDERTGFVM